MKVSFLNGRHIVKGEYSIPERLWGDHKSYILKAHRTVLLLDCPFVAHLSFDNLSRRLSLTLRPRALLSVKPDKCSIRGLWTSCPCTRPQEDSSSTHCLFTDRYLQRHCYRRWNTCLYFVTFHRQHKASIGVYSYSEYKHTGQEYYQRSSDRGRGSRRIGK